MKNRSSAIRRSENERESYEVLKSLERDPSSWHRLRAHLDLEDCKRLEANDLGELSELLRSEMPEGYSKFFMRMMLECGADQLLQKIKDYADEYYASASNEKEHLDRILREVVGIEGDLDQLSIIFESMGGDQR